MNAAEYYNSQLRPLSDEELVESEEQKAERLVVQGLGKLGWSNEDLKNRRKGERKKAKLAAQLRKETTMTWQWIAERLAMGHWRTARNAVDKIPIKLKG